jgi:hypothetical protein
VSKVRYLCLVGLILLISSGGASALTAKTDPDNVESLDAERNAPTNTEAEKWDFSFSSVAEFAAAVQRPTLKIVATGESKDIYYVFLRRDNYLYVVDWARRGGRITKENLQVTDAAGIEDVQVRDRTLSLPVTLVKTSTAGPPGEEMREVQLTYVKEIKATIFTIVPDFHGKLSVDFKVTNDKFVDAEASATFPWAVSAIR